MFVKNIEQNYRIEFKYGAVVYIDATSIDSIYSIDIDTDDKIMELNGIDGFVIGLVSYENTEEIGCLLYDENDDLDDNGEEIFCENGILNL